MRAKIFQSLVILVTAATWPAEVLYGAEQAQPPAAATESPEVHERTGIAAHKDEDALAVLPLPPMDSARQAAFAQIYTHLACACYQGGDLLVDTAKNTSAQQCSCDHAKVVRADLEQALAGLPTGQLANKQTISETLEARFVTLRPEYERLFLYPQAEYAWFMQNVRCVCEGCKPTVFFAKCQLSCTPAIVYKLRARIFMAFGFSKDELLDYYLAEFNASHAEREQITRDWLLPGKQRERGWAVPALAIGGAMLLLFGVVRRWTRKKPTEANTNAATASPTAEAKATPMAPATKRRIRDAVEDDADSW